MRISNSAFLFIGHFPSEGAASMAIKRSNCVTPARALLVTAFQLIPITNTSNSIILALVGKSNTF